MDTLTAAADAQLPDLTTNHLLGSVSIGGAALVVTVVLLLGVKGKGKHKFTHEHAGILGFIAGTLYAAAGQVWAFAGSLTTALAGTVTGPDGPFGDVGMGAVALVLFFWWLLGKPRAGKGALLGIASAGAFSAAGGIWGIAPALVLTIATHLGLR